MNRMYSPVPNVQGFARAISSVRSMERCVRSVELAALLSFFLMLSACTPTNQLALDPPEVETQAERRTAVEHSLTDVEYRLHSEISEWAGTPHELGGTTAKGIDCSAFVQKVYERAFNIQLPRTTREQVGRGALVKRGDLRPGDLVFFKLPTKTRHVGIYLKDGDFAHASSSQGVTTSDLDQDYWTNSYWTSRRILPESEGRSVTDRTRVTGSGPRPNLPREDASEGPKRERVGW